MCVGVHVHLTCTSCGLAGLHSLFGIVCFRLLGFSLFALECVVRCRRRFSLTLHFGISGNFYGVRVFVLLCGFGYGMREITRFLEGSRNLAGFELLFRFYVSLWGFGVQSFL